MLRRLESADVRFSRLGQNRFVVRTIAAAARVVANGLTRKARIPCADHSSNPQEPLSL
jgi:hypothetical protein